MRIKIITPPGKNDRKEVEVEVNFVPRIGEYVVFEQSEGNYMDGRVQEINHVFSSSRHDVLIYLS